MISSEVKSQVDAANKELNDQAKAKYQEEMSQFEGMLQKLEQKVNQELAKTKQVLYMDTLLITGQNCDLKPPAIEPPKTPIDKDCIKAESSVKGIIGSLLGMVGDDKQKTDPKYIQGIIDEVAKCQVTAQTKVSINIFNQCKEMELEKLKEQVVRNISTGLSDDYKSVETDNNGQITIGSEQSKLIAGNPKVTPRA